jgi:hypothetical protein
MSFFFKRKPDDKPAVEVIFSPAANAEINNFPLECQLRLTDAISYLRHTRYREEKKTNLYVIAEGNNLWSLAKGNIWLAYYLIDPKNIQVVWVSIISKLRKANQGG